MGKIDEYRASVAHYYSSTARPYLQTSEPAMAYAPLTPESALHQGSKLFLYGAAGIGKTTFLDWTAAHAASTSEYIPIFIPLRNYCSTLNDLINVSISRFADNVTLKDLTSGREIDISLLYLLDGLDELPAAFSHDAICEIQKIATRCQSDAMVVTSRFGPDSDSWLTWTTREIRLLTHDDIHRVLVEEGAVGLWDSVIESEDLIQLAQRPAFLHTMVEAWKRGADFRNYLMAEIPRYTAWRGHTKSTLPTDVSPQLIDEALCAIAYEMIIHNVAYLPKDRVEGILAKVLPEGVKVADFLMAVTNTGVVVGGPEGLIGFTHKSLVESYAARALLIEGKDFTSKAIDFQRVASSSSSREVAKFFFAFSGDEQLTRYSKSNPSELARLTSLAGDFGARRLLEAQNPPETTIDLIERATESTLDLSRKLELERKKILVISVHGFNTRGEWKNRLGFNLSMATDGVRFLHSAWDYGEFKLGILNPFSRGRKVKLFQSYYNDLMSKCDPGTEVCVVAHSFGTYIVGHALRRFPEIKFDRALFIGSALPGSFDWGSAALRIGSLFNIYSAADKALFFARFVPGLGDAGRTGFKKVFPNLTQRSQEFSDHSDLFGDCFMREVWLPYFEDGATAE